MTEGSIPDRSAPENSKVGLVIVSHSAKIADGIVDLAGQMAGGTRMLAAGGTDDGGIGTSFDRVSAAIGSADSEAGVVVLCDLGSAILTAETALDFVDDSLRERVRIADAPIVEGSVAAAVAAEIGQDLAAVLSAAESAGRTGTASSEVAGGRHPLATTDRASSPDPITDEGDAAPVSGDAVLRNKEGLHARPAAEFVKLAHEFDARVTVNGVDAKSLLRIMSLGLTAGSSVSITAAGPDAGAAVEALVALVESGFGE